MTYVYRDPDRLRGRPVHIPEESGPVEVPAAPTLQPIAAPVVACPAPTPVRPAPKKNPSPTPAPIWGGRLGLMIAAAEVLDWERRNRYYHHPPRKVKGPHE